MKLISGTAHRALAERIAEQIGTRLADVSVTSFPDGETFVKINENIRGEDVFIIQPTCAPNINDNLVELLLLLQTLQLSSAKRVTAVLPYYGSARQDRKTKARVPISAAAVANMIETMGAHRVVTMDLHW